MGVKKVLPTISLIADGVMSGTSAITSEAQNIQNLDNIGIQVSWTGTPTGTISVLASNDGATFYDLTFSPVLTQPTGADGGYLINLNQVPFPYIQVSYTNSSGSGIFNASLFGKDVN